QLPENCTEAPFTLQVRRAGNGENEPMEILGATAVMEKDLRSYRIYLADYELDPNESVYTLAQQIPEGKMMITIGLQTDHGNAAPPIEKWKKLKVGDVAMAINESRGALKGKDPNGEPISTVWMNTKDGPTSRTSDRKTRMKVLHVSENWVCLEADVTSSQGIQLSGIITAKVRP
ncbi:MAG: hypothetical protein AAF745_13975, partial [Planctomycetota bacterium]